MAEASPVAPGAIVSWNERSDLAAAIAGLHEDDFLGVLALLYHHRGPVVESEVAPDGRRRVWVDLDTADAGVLTVLQDYVARCKGSTALHPASMCGVCHGQWDPRPVIRCGTEQCENGVHPSCFGECVVSSPYVPWYCWECSPAELMAKFCTLCGLALGLSARKSTDHTVVHIECVTYTPEASFADTPTLEPVDLDGMASIPPWRTSRACSICYTEGGVTLSCDAGDCETVFHAICVMHAMQAVAVADNPLAVWCEDHVPVLKPGTPLLHSNWTRQSFRAVEVKSLPPPPPPPPMAVPRVKTAPVDVYADYIFAKTPGAPPV